MIVVTATPRLLIAVVVGTLVIIVAAAIIQDIIGVHVITGSAGLRTVVTQVILGVAHIIQPAVEVVVVAIPAAQVEVARWEDSLAAQVEVVQWEAILAAPVVRLLL